MEYLHRKELESDPVVESTAVTMKSIKELLAEEEARLAQAARDKAGKESAQQIAREAAPQAEVEVEVVPGPEPEPEPEVPAQPVLQTPPTVPPSPHRRALPAEGDDQADEAVEAPRPPLITRLFGRG